MVAGPIERYNRLGVQLRENHPYRYENISLGFRMVLYGLFVKMCIADNMAPIVNQVYEHPENFSHLSVITALIAFSIQIYADFYGYSTIAIGAAKMMGINLMDNFKQPYFSTSIREFWQRWHISLSSWFRDYVFIPMGGSRVNLFRLIINILFVFALSGFWHGANYTFIIWGLLHGLAYLIEFGFNKIPGVATIAENKIVRFFLGIKTFLLVTFIWIFFRAENMTQAKNIINEIYKTSPLKPEALTVKPWILIPFAVFFLLEILIRNKRLDSWLNVKSVYFRWSLYFITLVCIMLFSGIKSYPFIYFRF
jgi:D-alanyl-lipoteichoic acid acyltransferase DltB (MBOAT superfamily)